METAIPTTTADHLQPRLPNKIFCLPGGFVRSAARLSATTFYPSRLPQPRVWQPETAFAHRRSIRSPDTGPTHRRLGVRHEEPGLCSAAPARHTTELVHELGHQGAESDIVLSRDTHQ